MPGNSNAHTDVHAYADNYVHADKHGNAHCHADRDGYTYGDADADTHVDPARSCVHCRFTVRRRILQRRLLRAA